MLLWIVQMLEVSVHAKDASKHLWLWSLDDAVDALVGVLLRRAVVPAHDDVPVWLFHTAVWILVLVMQW